MKKVLVRWKYRLCYVLLIVFWWRRWWLVREEMPQPLPTDGKQATELLCNAMQVAGVCNIQFWICHHSVIFWIYTLQTSHRTSLQCNSRVAIFSLVFVTIMKYFDFVHCKYAAELFHSAMWGSAIFNLVFVTTILNTPKMIYLHDDV